MNVKTVPPNTKQNNTWCKSSSLQMIQLSVIFSCWLINFDVMTTEEPVKPSITDCRVDNWENMTCWWEPVVQDTGIETTQTLYWTLTSVLNLLLNILYLDLDHLCQQMQESLALKHFTRADLIWGSISSLEEYCLYFCHCLQALGLCFVSVRSVSWLTAFLVKLNYILHWHTCKPDDVTGIHIPRAVRSHTSDILWVWFSWYSTHTLSPCRADTGWTILC